MRKSMMETHGGTSVPTAKEFQIEGSWAPLTPLKPILPRPGPICEVTQRGGLTGQTFVGELDDYLTKYSLPDEGLNLSLGSTWSSLKPAEMSMPNIPDNTQHGIYNIWQADDRVNYQKVNEESRMASSYPNFAAWDMPLPWENNAGSSSIGFENMSFGELLAMNGSAVTPSLISERLEDCGVAVMRSSFHGLNHQHGTTSLDSSSVFRSQQGFQQLNQQFVPHCAYPWSQSNINSSPRTMNINGEHFAFAPQTPDSRWKEDNIMASGGTNMVARQFNGLQEHEVGDAIVDSQDLNIKEVVEPATCSSPGKVSIAGEENHSPDNGDIHCIDLNKTPLKKPRRRRYQPKVIKENKPKRTPKPKTPKPTQEKEGPRNRRKYVRKNKADTTTGETKTTENKPRKQAPKSCKKSINFDLDGEGKSKDDSNAEPQTTGDLANAQKGNQEVSCPDQVTLTKETEKANGNLMGDNAGESSSPCASSSEGMQRRGTKRVLSSITGKTDVSVGNVDINHSTYCPPNHIYLHNVGNNGVPNFAIPEIYKKQRIDPGQGSHGSSTSSYVTACEDQVAGTQSHSKYYQNTLALHRSNVETSNQVEILMRCAGNRVQLLNTWLDITRLKTPTQPESALHDHNLDPLEGVPLFSHAESKGKAPPRKKSHTLKTYQPGNSNHSDQVNSVNSNTGASTEDINKKTKPRRRSRNKNPESGSTSRGKKGWEVVLRNDKQRDWSTSGSIPMPPRSMTILLKAITEGLKQLDLNKEQSALVPYQQNALVLYKNDGTLVPFGGQFDPVKKRQRAKVELDDETTRVWMLLLENIDNDGIDGTDEEKKKWWENERSVFHGRVESFIARMRLVQGDRRFTPWKGSVLDSVIGVFLTQNVSDHLSSSAFMSLAARFPIKSNSCGSASSEETAEPDVCIIQPEESITWNDKQVNNNEIDHTKIEYVSTQERVRAASGSVSPIDCFSGLKVTSGSILNKDNTHITETDNLGNYDATSSLQSVISSQNSIDSPVQPESNSKTQSSMASSSQSDYFGCSTSFLGLLKMAGSPMLHDSYNQLFGYDLEKAPDMCSREHQGDKESVSQLKDTSIQMIGVESKSCATFSKDEIGKDSPENVGSSTLGQTSPIWNGPNLTNSSQETADVTTGSTVTLDRTNNSHKEASGHSYPPGANPMKSKRQRPVKEKKSTYDWDSLRKQAQANGRNKERPPNTRDSLDWEAVRHADVSVLADTIKERGMNNVLAGRIKDFLDKLVKDHGSTDLEWLRDVPPDKAKEYLLSFRGLGLKSVECVRLLTLHHLAFPVDTNVGRIAVRLGWVPLQPLPESLQLHLLELYPILETIQQYLWPRLCKLDQKTLYELHYHLITFGKVFCTKRQPNCNACPLRGECRHFASAFASARLALPGPEERSIMAVNKDTSIPRDPHNNIKLLSLPPPTMTNDPPQTNPSCNNDATVVELPSTSLSLTLTQPTFDLEQRPRVDCEPIVEVPASPEPEPENEEILCDIEDSILDDPNEIPTIELNMEKFTQTLQNVMQANRELQEGGMSRALVALTPEAASIPTPKLKNISRLRTEHHVYELPDTHPLLTDWDKREHDDPCSYLLAIWTPGETANTIHPPDRRCSSDDPNILCYEETCAYCSSQREVSSQTVRGTLLIPCRTAMRGSFPLNGTYFQVNEVFADHESSLNPINVPRSWLWNLPRRTVYFGTSVPTIFKGLTTEEIQHCFWRGFVCVRGFDKRNRAPRPLMARLHFPASRMPKGAKGKANEE